MISCLHDWGLLILWPNLASPIADWHEVLDMGWISLERVDWTMMLPRFDTESVSNFNHLSFVSLKNVSLLCSNQILKRTSIWIVLERCTSKQFFFDFSVNFNLLIENNLFSWKSSVSLFSILGVIVPPEKLSVGWRGNAFCTWFKSKPLYVINGVIVRLIKNSGENWLDNTLRVSIPRVEERDWTIIWTTNYNIAVFGIESNTTEWRWRQQSFFREIWLAQIPNIGFTRHVFWHLLESKHRVSNTNSELSWVRVPADLSSRSLDCIRVFKDHLSLDIDVISQ